MFSKDDFVTPQKQEFLSFYMQPPPTEAWSALHGRLRPENLVEFQWLKYFQGLHFLSLNQEVDALETFKKIYHQGRTLSSTTEADFFRLMGLSLMQMSQLYRQNSDFEKSYYYASVAFEYFQAFGNLYEKIQSALDLEFLAIPLGDLHLSLAWAQKAMDFCYQIPSLERRLVLLSESFLKTAESLRALGLIFEAEKQAGEALDLLISNSSSSFEKIGQQKKKVFLFLAQVHEAYCEQAKTEDLRKYHLQRQEYFLNKE